MRKKVEKKDFEKQYFSGYYRRNVGRFEGKDLEKSMNWFSGWFQYLQKFIDLKKGKAEKY